MAATSRSGSAERRARGRAGFMARALAPIYGIIRWSLGHARGFYGVLGTYLVIGLVTVAAALGMFALLAQGVFHGPVQRVDEALLLRAGGLRSDLLDVLALIGVGLGSGAAAWVVILAGSLFLWRTRHHFSALLLWVSLGGARVLNEVLKEWYGRPRPKLVRGDLEILGRVFAFPTSPSFPSGHALTSTVIFFTIAYLVARIEATRRMRRVTMLAAAGVVVLVGFSRVYLGVHYPSDVVAGVLAGILWSTFAVLGIEVLRYFWPARPDVLEEEADLERGIEPLRETLPGGGGLR